MAAQAKSGETELLAKIGERPEEQRGLGQRLHRTIMAAVPELRPKLHYGRPGYSRGGPVLVFFRNEDGLISIAFTENASFPTSDPLVPQAWFVNGLDETAEAARARPAADTRWRVSRAWRDR